MRRSTAISQVLLLLALYVVPLLAVSMVATPACCRRDGAHHCGMQERGSRDETSFSNSVHCPYCFPAVALTHTTKLFLSASPFAIALRAKREGALSDDTDPWLMQLAADIDSRGPPSLTL